MRQTCEGMNCTWNAQYNKSSAHLCCTEKEVTDTAWKGSRDASQQGDLEHRHLSSGKDRRKGKKDKVFHNGRLCKEQESLGGTRWNK